MIDKIRAMIQDVLKKHDALLLPGEGAVLDALAHRLLVLGEGIPSDTLEGIRGGVAMVSRSTGDTVEYHSLIDDLQYVDDAFQARLDDRLPVTIVVRITLPGKYNGGASCGDLANLLYGIDDGQVDGSVEASIEKEGDNRSWTGPGCAEQSRFSG